MANRKKQSRKHFSITRNLIERIVYRTMRIEEPSMTHHMAKKAARKMRLPR